ncbi:hypothetical protein [Vibrio sp. 1180_3]|uniref:hypothetical protein n=1 Tax=Vibrio sp. 1180_3 TaxID=2528832 RepID=UPI002406C0DE|nr:hypothetical protein [Vibrio sp. 1180_3]MDF9401754.1 hypothetical protein [Vibrio sp. 1180_3]
MATSILVPIGVVTASIIAGLFSFISLVLSKEQKVSEFRQQWIDSLREEVAIFIGNIVTIADISKRMRRAQEQGVESEFSRSDLKDFQVAASEAYTRINLRLNPDDDKSEVIDLIQALEQVRKFTKQAEWEKVNDKIDDVRSNSQALLKLEWERVKKGEPAFRRAKGVAALLVISALALGGLFLFGTQ